MEAGHRERLSFPPEEAFDPAPVIEALAFRGEGDPRGVLAETAIWLALENLGPRAGEELAAARSGSWWSAAWPDGAEALAPHPPPLLVRIAVGVVLQRCAGNFVLGASERTLCALASVALGCADPEAGRALQPGLGGLGLLELIDKIPVAAQVRTLLLEFRHLRLDQDVPAPFVARIEDLLERFDREKLTAARLEDRLPGPREAEELRMAALVRSRSPRLLGLLRVLLRAPGGFTELEPLLAACREDAPAAWEMVVDGRAAAALESAYGQLRERLQGTSLRLKPRAEGWGISTSDGASQTGPGERPEG